MRLSYNDVFKFYILLIRISQVFCSESIPYTSQTTIFDDFFVIPLL